VRGKKIPPTFWAETFRLADFYNAAFGLQRAFFFAARLAWRLALGTLHLAASHLLSQPLLKSFRHALASISIARRHRRTFEVVDAREMLITPICYRRLLRR